MEVRGVTNLQQNNVLFSAIFCTIALAPLMAILFSHAPKATALFPLLFVGVGLCVALFRRGFGLHTETRRITKWWGIWWPVRTTSIAYADVTRVLLDMEVRGSGKSKQTVFAVRIEQTPGDTELFAPTDYHVARRAAERVANTLEVAMRDASSDVVVLREAGTLDEPLRERILRERGGTAPPSDSPPGRLTVTEDGDAWQCTLPRPGFNRDILSRLGFAAFFVAALFIGFNGAQEPEVKIVMSGFAVLAFAIIAAPAIVRRLFPPRVRYSKEGVTFVRALAKPQTIAAHELEDLFVVPVTSTLVFSRGGGLVARRDHETITIDVPMTAEERQWLYDAICFTLATRAWGYRGG